MKLITVLSCVLLFCAISVQSEKLEASPGEINKFEDAPENDEEVDNNWFELQHETIEQQADQPTSGEQFIAIRIGAAGTKDEVNPNLAGLVRIATEFLPKTYTFVKIVSASREVVAGIKYELLVNALNDNKAEVQCDIRVLEQPWIITSENEKLRSLIYTNCSNGEPISNEPLGDNVQHRINPIFNNEEKVMTAERLKDMESLIIPSDGKTPRPPQENLSDRPKTIQSQVSQPREEDDDTLTVVTLSQGTSSFLDDFFSFGKTENKPIQSSSIENEVIPKLQTPTRVEAIADRGESENNFYHVAPNVNGETQTPIVSNTETSTQSATVQVNPIEEKQANVEVPQIKCTVIQSTDDVVPGTDTLSESITSNVDTMTARQKRESMYGYDPMIMERVLLNKLLTDALARLDRYDDDDNKRVPVRVLHRHVVNDLFTLDVTVADTKCSEMASRTDNCRMKIIDDSIKLCRLEIEHLENDDIKLKKSECAPYTNKKRPLDDTRHKRDDQIVGGVSVIPNSEVEPILSEVLSEGDYQSYRIKRNDEIMIKPKIVKGGIRPLPESENSNIETLLSDMLVGGDYQSYRLVRVIEASRQVVAGSLYRIKGEFEVGGIQKICNVKLWVKVARQGKEITEFICDESGNRSKRQILGGISPTSDTHTTINLLNEVLSSGDYQSYSLVRIIESTIQTVSGRLYKIKAEFSIDQTSKICNIKIWDRPWLGKSGREVEFNCDKKSRRKRQIRGGFKSIKVVEKEIDSDFLKYIENILEDVIRRCEYQSYKLIRVIDSTSEVLDGFMFRIKAEFSVNDLLKICNINIWEKENGHGVEVQKFLCQDRTKTNDVRSLITADEDLNIEYIVGEDSIKEDGKHSESKKSQHSTTVATTVGFIPIPEEDKSKVEKLLQEVFAYDDYKSYTLVKILQSWQQVVAGINYKVRAEVKVRGKSKICDIKILNMFTRKGKRVVQSVCQNILEVIPSKNITSNDATVYIESIVNGVLRQENYQSYRLVRIIKVTKEKLEGIVYHITAEFTVDGTQKLCNLKIWDKVSNQHREVQEFICEESNTSDLGGTTTRGVISQEGPVRILGGISSTTHADKPLIEKILTGVLASGDYQSYRLVRIIEFTKQVVAGILYRIKAEFAVDGDLKICNVTIWEKVSNEGREVQEFMCERSGTSVVEGPTSSVIVTSQHSIPTSVVKESTTGSVINTLQPSAIRGGIRPTTNDDKPTIENILNEILTSGDYQSYRLIRIIESTKQTVAGILYRIKAEFVVDGTQKICNVRIWDKVSNQGREVQEFICEEPSTVVVEGETTGYVISHEHSVPSFGGISPTTDADKPTIENILNGVLASGDYKSYRLVRIIASTKQIVAGILYRIKAEFAVDGAQKICNVRIWNKVSNQGREIQEFMCEEPNIAVVGGATTDGVITHEHSVPILGGISPTTDADKPTIENILNGVLASGDYKSYRLVRIIESTKQIVAGILYRIKAEFAVDGAQKICNVQILEKVLNEGREVLEFMCEEPNIAVVGGATTGGIITHEHSVPILGGISPTTDADKPTIENILNGVLASGDYKSYRLVRIIESTKQIVAGILYRIKAEFAVDGAQKICNVQILEKVSNEGREVQEFMCDEPNIAVGGGATAGGVITHEHSVPILGGITPTTDADKPTIENILNGVLASGDYKSYRLVRIIESTKQIVAGILYRIKAEFAVDGAQKICKVRILEKVSNEGREVQEFMCDEPNITVVGGATTGGVITHDHSVPIPGGISPTTDADKPTIENILNGVLASGDYKSYRLVRIIESTKQIVAGILYRIKAEFAVDGAQKICNVRILEKVSDEGREVQEFMCDEPNITVVGGATTGGVITHEHSVPIPGGISPTTDADKPTIENILNGVLASGDYKSYRLVRIIESTKQIVAGILYRIKAEFAVDGAQKICNVQILEKVSNEGREVQEFMCDEPNIAVGGGATTGGVITHEHSVPILGGITPTTDADKPTIENILNGVLASGDYKSYRLVRIIESTKQIVAGILYRIKAEFAVDGAQKICKVRILEKVSNEGREVQEFMCDEPNITVVGGATTGGVITHEHSVPIPGGISPTTDADKPTIENILNGVLASGDYKSYRLVRIIESTKQIVAGILYRIKAEFAVDGAQKICNVQILEKVSNEGREVQEFMCDEPNIAVVGGAITGGVITHEHSVPILGGITPTTDADKPTIENILNGVLASGDYKSYRLVRIIESTKQIVAGILYRIKAEFAVDGAQKICNVQILEKVSNEGREVQEFMCDEPNIAVGGGATTGGVITHEHSVPILGGITPTTDADKPTIENILNGVLASGDYKSYRLVRIIESTKQIVAGILYRIKAEFAVDGAQKICNVRIWEKVSNQGREVQEFMCDEPNIAVVGGATTGGVITHEHSVPIPGGISPTTDADKPAIENILNGFLASGDYKSYRLVRIIESTKQVVAGILYRIKAEFAVDGAQKICNVQILEKVSNEGREVQEFMCEEPNIPVVGGATTGGVITHEHSVPILGGITPTTDADKPTIENILNGVLASGDYKSYRLVRIIESTKQIVAGILYRIKAEFAVDGAQKICNLRIWDKVSNQGREVQEFMCDEPTIAVVGGAIPGGVITHEQSVPILGGISPTTDADKPTIENILNGVLASGDYKSYRLVRIIESTKQIVAGILYRIKAEFAVDGAQKICNVQILEKVSNEGREVQEFMCDEPNIAVVGGASTGGVITHEQSVPILGGITPTTDADKPTIENILNGVLASGDYKSYRLVRIIESTKQVVAGILYRIKAEFAVDGAQKICNVQILEKVSNEGREVQEFMCEEPNIPVVGGATTGGVITHEHSVPILGGITPTTDADKPTIENILNGVLASGDYKSYRLVRIIESTKQIVAGILYRIKAEFAVDGAQKICNLRIWDKVSNQGREVQEFMCDEPTIAVVGGAIPGGVITHEQSVPILGGISPTTDADKPTIENILNGVLASGDYKSYRLVRIIESTKQIVAGILYRIKAEFAVDGAQKICNVQILEKVSNEGREVQEFMCDEPNIAVVGGASTGGVITHEQSVPILGGITPTTDADKPTIENILNGVLASGDYKSYRLVRIIESTKQIVAGILYRIKAEFAVDGAQKICNVQILEKVSNEGREVQEFMCDEPNIAVGGGATTGGVITHEHSVPILGGITPTTDADKPTIENILNGVLASGDYKSYRLVRIIESTKQIVAGILYRIKAEFAVDGAQKICNVRIWEKVSNQGREVQEFMCEEPNITVVGGATTGGVITHEHSVPIPGGISPTTDADKPTIENILNGVLASGDYKSYRLVRIIESTKQIVAGILYRIKAEFAVDGAQKICNVQILEKVSNEGREVQEFMCDEPNIAVVGGATTGGVITHEHSVPILGGITPTTDADKPTIENILNGVLASGDYKSYRLVRIIESTKQIVAGILYRIKAEFAVDGAQKICNVQILEKVSNEGREVQEFMCDEPNIAVGGGATTGGVITQEHSVPILGGITPTTDADKPTIENILNGVLASGDYKSYRLVRIIESTKQIVAGILYRIKAEFAVDGAQKICNVRIWEKVSNQGREVQEFMCDEPNIAVVGGATTGGVITHEHSVPILGGITPTTDADKPTIENILNGVLASGDYKSYRLVRIIESTKQVVAGILYRIKAEFAVDGAQKICNVQILEKVSNEGREVQEFMCEEPNIPVVGGATTGGVITHEHSVPILGGITPTTDADKPTIENILNGVLASGDYKSYRLVRIIESTKQIVAGILYRIKAEFAVDGAQKICNVQILEKVSNEGREVQEFMCDEPNIAVVGGATTGGVITHEHSVPILGGITPTTDADKPTIENILNGVLASGDYKSYRLVRIIESTKQIVAGILYRIKAEFAVDGAQKICNVQILEKVSNEGREVQEFMCDEPNIAVGGGATTGGVITHEHSVPILGGISPTTDADKPTIENILNEVLASGDYKSYRLVRIIESTKQIVAGILYRIKAEFAVNGAQKICNVQILEKVSNEGREVQEFMCDEPNIAVGGGATTGGVITHEHSVPILGGISPTTDADKPTIENILNGVLASGDYKSYRLVRIIESTKQIVAGILYRIKAEFAVDGAQKICNVQILEKVSNEGREVQEFMCDEPNIAVGGGATTGGVITHEHSVPIPGGISPTTDADKPAIENILNGVLASGDYKSYRLVRIIESTKQIVAGILYRIKAEFAVNGAQKICNVQILEKVSNEGREVQEFMCEEPNIPVVGGATTGGVITHEHSVPILGGISPTTDADKPTIENILNGVLASGDYKSYRLVRIIESTKQIVAGILYRIKAEFEVDGAQKICNVQILEKVSNEGREVQEFMCDEPNIAVGGGATTGGVITHEHSVPIPGGISPTTDADKPAIENILNGVLASGDYKSYRLVRIIESTKQIVAGILYRIKAEFAVNGAQKICNVQILEKVSNEGREVQEFMCEEPNIPVVGGATTGGVITHEHSVPILGGISPTTDADKPTIENILNGVLASGDYKSYRLVRIIESTKQIVAGILYRIKAEFEVDGAQKICNVRIWDKVSNEGREVQEFMCEERNTVIEESNTSAIESILNGVLSSGEYHSYKLVKIIKFTTKIEAGVLYDITGEFLVNGVGHICDVKIWDGDSHQGGKSYSFNCTQIIPNGFNPVPVQDVSKEANVNNANHNIPGGISATSDADKTIIESLLNEVLSEGDYRSYRLLRIIESSEQVVAGLLYRIKAEFDVDGENKICNIQIWAKVSNQGNEVTQFNCFIQQPVLGGVHSMSYAEENEVITLLNNILDTGDYQSYRLLNIIEIKRQIVAGVLYKIKAEFDLDGAEKICDITILQKLMNQGNEVTKFSCVRKRAISRRSSSSSSGSDSDSSESSEKSNKNKIRNVLYDVLDDDEYRSYRLVRIIQGSRQKLTTGTLYFIEAIFLIDGDEKQCNVNINQRSRTNRKVYFNCDTQIPLTLSIRGGFSVVPTSEFPYIQNLVTEVLSDRRFQSSRVVRIIEAKNQVVSGMKYRVKGIFAVEEVEQTCVIYIYVDISDVKEVTEFNCEQPQVQQTSTFLWRKTRQADDEIFVLGGTTPVDESEKPYVQSLLNEVLISGDYQSYSLVRIIESKRQTVAGILYTIKAEFMVDGASKTCTLTIWEKPWLGKSSRVVEFKECDGESLTRAKRNAPGSSRPVDQEEYPKIEHFLTSALATGDQQNYRLARVLHATKQLSSGWTYKIRAVFDVDGTTRRCNIKLWNRPWLSNASTIESFKCDEHDEHTIRINHDAKIKRTLDFYLHNNFTDNKIFEMYEKLYNKNYQTTLSRNMRLRIFKTNLRKIRLLNQNEQGTATYGVTEFADLTPTEYRMRTGLVPRTSHSNHIGNPIAEIPNVRLPREFDWRTRGAVSEVKNQGSCGSCWAFSVIGNIEGIHAIKTGVLEEYSEQELVDCDTIDNGCNGGLPDDAYKAIEQIGGLETEKDYPYTARRGHCSFNATKVKTQIKGAVDLPKNETAIAQWLLQNGPVSIGINANAMQFYRGGVSHPWRVLCNKSNLDHGVLIVGFGVHDYPKFNKTLPYWIIKNSWGPRWGEQGYYRVYRGDNTCGVSEMVSSAVLE